jgi:hypothetical protein
MGSQRRHSLGLALVFVGLSAFAEPDTTKPLTISLSWDVLSLPRDSYAQAASFRQAYELLGLQGDFDRMRSTDFSGRSALLDQMADKLSFAMKAKSVIQAGIGGGSSPTEGTREQIKEGLANLYNATVMIRGGLEANSKRSVKLLLQSDTGAAKALKEGRADLAFFSGPDGAALGSSHLKPLLVGARSSSQAEQGLETRVILDPTHPALRNLDKLNDVVGAKPKSYDEFKSSTAEGRRAKEATSRAALAGNGDIVGFEPLGEREARLEETLDREIQFQYEEANRNWLAAGSDEERKGIHDRYLAKKAETERYYKNLTDKAVLVLTDRGMKKLMKAIQCEPLAQNKIERPHTLRQAEALVRRYGRAKPSGYFKRGLSGESSTVLGIVEKKERVAIVDKYHLAVEQSQMSGAFSYGLLAVRGPSPPVTPVSALWFNPERLSSEQAEALRATLSTNTQNDRGAVQAIAALATGALYFFEPPADYAKQLETYRKRFPDRKPIEVLTAKDCEEKTGGEPGAAEAPAH